MQCKLFSWKDVSLNKYLVYKADINVKDPDTSKTKQKKMFEWQFFNAILEYFSSRKENKGNKNSIRNRSVIIFVTKVEQLAHYVTFTIVV